MIYTGHLMLMA